MLRGSPATYRYVIQPAAAGGKTFAFNSACVTKWAATITSRRGILYLLEYFTSPCCGGRASAWQSQSVSYNRRTIVGQRASGSVQSNKHSAREEHPVRTRRASPKIVIVPQVMSWCLPHASCGQLCCAWLVLPYARSLLLLPPKTCTPTFFGGSTGTMT